MSQQPIPLHGEPEPSEFKREGLSYVFEPRRAGQPVGIRFRVERVKPGDDTLWGLLSVTASLPGLPREVLGPHRHNFFASRSSLVGELTKSFEPKDWPEDRWRQMVQRLTKELIQATRARASVDEIGAQELPPQTPDLVEKLIQDGQMALVFGPGGAGKGWLSIALALCVKYGRDFCGLKVRQAEPLYLDAEADFETFLRRVKAVARGLGLDGGTLTRMGLVGAGPLSANLEQISREIGERQSRLIVHDSVGKLSVQIGQHGTYEDAAKEFSDACAALGPGLSHLLVDHVSGEGLGKSLAGKPINSVRKLYDARVAWEIRKEQEHESRSQLVGLYHAKNNNTEKFRPIGIRLDFESDAYGRAVCVRFQRQDVLDSAELGAKLPLSERILYVLGHSGPGGLTIVEIAKEVGQDKDVASVAATLRYLRKKGHAHTLDLNPTGGAGQVDHWVRTAQVEENPKEPERTRKSLSPFRLVGEAMEEAAEGDWGGDDVPF